MISCSRDSMGLAIETPSQASTELSSRIVVMFRDGVGLSSSVHLLAALNTFTLYGKISVERAGQGNSWTPPVLWEVRTRQVGSDFPLKSLPHRPAYLRVREETKYDQKLP
ncbi:hypothetical protein TNCV_1274051 [Trichonephila clavipes]|nr:hypothetical protein TNCV_1274051 [Trichonephila clavipes]